MSFIIGFLLGVLGSIIANLIYRSYIYNKKPDIVICEKMILTYNSSNVPALKIKIYNNSSHEVVDIQIKLFGIKNRDKSNTLKSLHPLSSYCIDYLPAINDKNCDYAYRPYLTSINHKNIHNEIKKFEKLLLFVRATDVYNSTITVKKEIFNTNELIEHGWDFDKCKSCDVTQNTHISIPTEQEIENNLKNQKIKDCPFLK